MPRTPDSTVAHALHAALLDLPFVIESAGCSVSEVPLASYPGRARPTSVVRVGEGRGENVAWSKGAHEDFRDRVAQLPRGRWRLGAWAATVATRFHDPYERAALEAAAIDLGLRQRGTDLAALVGAEPQPARYVVSFERVSDPVARAADESPEIGLKIDVDPDWEHGTLTALGATGRVAVLDFKGAGTATDAERAHDAIPRALVEDPGGSVWSPALRRWLSFDAAVTSVAALDELPVRPAAVNLKPARMGGVLEVLACAARCAERDIGVYLGGMFEVGPGRRQLAALAALLCPEAPNDIAPLVSGERPPRLVSSRVPGFA
ncbi:MAG TPA: hypothetical protein VKU61_13085 [Candidatus Binatia bacterium]|nr:hypothetical protein [Candidatus Binatia bacterium]